MINVDLIRRVQASILDETRPFNMSAWACCIAGHTLQLAGVDSEWVRLRALEADTHAIVSRAAALLCIDHPTAEHLFTGAGFPPSLSPSNRRRAVDALEALVIAEAARCAAGFALEPQEAPFPAGSALEPRSRSARAESKIEAETEAAAEPDLVLA